MLFDGNVQASTPASLFNEQELLDALDDRMQALLDGADGRSVIARVTLIGRSELKRFFRHPNTLNDLTERVVNEWANQKPFVWCERIDGTDTVAIRSECQGRGL